MMKKVYRCLLAIFFVTAFLDSSAAWGQTPGGPGDRSPHIDIGVDTNSNQLVFGFTGIEANTPIVIDRFVSNLPGGGSGFVNTPFSADQDIAFRTASNQVAMDLGFSSFGQVGQGTPQISAELVDLDPEFSAFVFPASLVDAVGESFVLNTAGNGIDFHPNYILTTNDPDFIGRVEASFRFVPLTQAGFFSASDPFDLVFVVGGDFDDDSRLTYEDQLILNAAIDVGSTETRFDLNRDLTVDDQDLDFFLTELLALSSYSIADIDLNGTVDELDLALLAQNYDQAGPNLLGDLDRDGQVDLIDLTIMGGQWGSGSTPTFSEALAQGGFFSVPEPSSALLLLLGGLMFKRRLR